MRVFLSGPMGAGKSTVARELGRMTRAAVVDTDELICREQGLSVAEIFRTRGEPAFRELERALVERLLSQRDDVIVALGGGAVTHAPLRRELLRRAVLVTLTAPATELAARVGAGQGRPLLDGEDVLQRLTGLRSERAAAYSECHAKIDTASLIPAAAADRILEVAKEPPVVVPLGDRTYRVEVAPGARGRAAARSAALGSVSQVVVVTDTEVGPRYGDALAAALQAAGLAVAVVTLAAGETAKNLGSVERIWSAALDAGADRGALLLGVGGGVVGDLAGFAAATLHRGVRVAHVPTTLLAMVDSSVGGKTGFDTRHGKNLVGAVHQPSFVLADVETLGTLPDAELRAGLAEVVKAAWIAGEDAVAALERDAERLLSRDAAAVADAIHMAVQLKADVVSEDEHELGRRAVLNLGHTLGHAIEAAQGYSGLRHGEAVSIGMVAAFRVAERLGRAQAAQGERMCSLLRRLALPTEVEPYLTPEVLARLSADKKRRGDQLRYVVPGAPGSVSPVPLPVGELARLLCG